MNKPFLLHQAAPRGTVAWVAHLAAVTLPMAAPVIAALNRLEAGSDQDRDRLVDLILRDPTLTARVLRLANSSRYSPDQPINTVSRALIMMGLNTVRALCLSALVIDGVLGKGLRRHIEQILARSLKRACLARELFTQALGAQSRAQGVIPVAETVIPVADSAIAVGENATLDEAESVFIAALLFNLAELTFWANQPESPAHQRLSDPDPAIRLTAENQLLGTHFTKITAGLARHWHLGPLLPQALSAQPLGLAARAVALADRITAYPPETWQSPAMQPLWQEAAALNRRDTPATVAPAVIDQPTLSRALEQAAKVYGLESVMAAATGASPVSVAIKKPPNSRIMKSDPQLQLNILRELAQASAHRRSPHTIFHLLIEGVHRGMGLERVVVAFLRQHIAKAQYCVGDGTAHWYEQFRFDTRPAANSLFAYAVQQGGLLWVKPDFVRAHKYLAWEASHAVTGGEDGLVYVFTLEGKKPGFIYADRGGFGGLITQAQADSFQHFALQAQRQLEALQKHPPETTPAKRRHVIRDVKRE